jgi:hypothetical protein
MATVNIGLKVNRAITGATTVNSGAYAMVTYELTAAGAGPAGVDGASVSAIAPITRYFGPGASIPATFNSGAFLHSTFMSTTIVSGTWTLLSGVELINTL